MSDSRISGLYRLTVAERIDELQERGWLSAVDAEVLRAGSPMLTMSAADKMIENVVAVFGLPLAIAPNFVVNGRDYIVPFVVEEPSIVAGVSSAAQLARAGGGFSARCDESLLVGQIHVTGMENVAAAVRALEKERDALLALANSVHPRLRDRGGGVRDIEIRRFQLTDAKPVIAVHLLVDTRDAMGANLVNTVCESVAPRVAELTAGDVVLRILSNFTDRSIVAATVRYPLAELAVPGFDAVAVRDRIVVASDIAVADPHRAVTHNKGIMNGVDAVAIATGNDWRAVEAGAHAYASASGRYAPLATWHADAAGDLIGEIRLPLKVGVVGGTLETNAAALLGQRITGVESATELAELIAAVGLAQNFAALRALATSGIQHGHMKLHARSLAAAAGVPDELHDRVVDELIASGTIKAWKAREVLDEVRSAAAPGGAPAGAAGKVILLGEHAVVYGRHALALPIPDAVTASVAASDSGSTVMIPDWGVDVSLAADDTGVGAAITLIMRELGVPASDYAITVRSTLPRAMGLGSSAAVAVAITRALALALDIDVDDEQVNGIAFACEKLAHGTPSGVDNTIATYAIPVLFRNAESLEIEELALPEPPPLVIALSSRRGLTKQQVSAVRSRYEQNPDRFDALFDEIDALSLAGAAALREGDYERLGAQMNIGHGLLNALGVSTPELESMVSIARAAGALGAKLTGAGGGGSVVILCPGKTIDVTEALAAAGYSTLSMTNKGIN